MNPHGLPLEPKSSASANSATPAYKNSLQGYMTVPRRDNCVMIYNFSNDALGILTPDNLIKSQVLYQLS